MFSSESLSACVDVAFFCCIYADAQFVILTYRSQNTAAKEIILKSVAQKPKPREHTSSCGLMHT